MKYDEPFPTEDFEAWEAQKIKRYENYFYEPQRKDEDELWDQGEINSNVVWFPII